MELEDCGDCSLDLSQGSILEPAPDLLPEYCHYKDEGCELADSCLDCPFPQCVYDEPGGKQHWLKTGRDEEINRLFSDEDKGIKELAAIFCVSRRTIQRALKRSFEQIRDNGQGKLNKGDTADND